MRTVFQTTTSARGISHEASVRASGRPERRSLPASNSTTELLSNAELVIAGGRSGIPSLARSVLVRRKCPVAVVIDSDSVDPDVIEERQQSTEDVIRAADASMPVKVVAAIPEIEAWFFASPEIIERMVGQKVSEEWLFWKERSSRCSHTACKGKQEKLGHQSSDQCAR